MYFNAFKCYLNIIGFKERVMEITCLNKIRDIWIVLFPALRLSGQIDRKYIYTYFTNQ